jgi:hypothetical protein
MSLMPYGRCVLDEVGSDTLERSEEMPWRLLMSLACSLLIVLGGMFWTYGIWRESNRKFHELYHVQETVQSLHANLGMREASVR